MVNVKFNCADIPSDELHVSDDGISDGTLLFYSTIAHCSTTIVLSYADVETLASTLQDWLIENKKA